MNDKDIMALFKKTKAFMTGHFRLSSGLHSGHYLQCALVLQYPKYAEQLCRELARKFKKDRPTAVIGPAMGGMLVSYETARQLGARSLFTERQEGRMMLRREFKLDKKDRVLAVEDVVTTGGSLKEVIRIVKESGAALIGVGSIVDRSGGTAKFGARFESLLKLNIETFPQEKCPLCEENIEIAKPGSRK